MTSLGWTKPGRSFVPIFHIDPYFLHEFVHLEVKEAGYRNHPVFWRKTQTPRKIQASTAWQPLGSCWVQGEALVGSPSSKALETPLKAPPYGPNLKLSSLNSSWIHGLAEWFG